jgi:hypothetical protein
MKPSAVSSVLPVRRKQAKSRFVAFKAYDAFFCFHAFILSALAIPP